MDTPKREKDQHMLASFKTGAEGGILQGEC
jgi:hypothetical protein